MWSASRHFQPGEGPSRGRLRDYEPSDGPSSQALPNTQHGLYSVYCEDVFQCWAHTGLINIPLLLFVHVHKKYAPTWLPCQHYPLNIMYGQIGLNGLDNMGWIMRRWEENRKTFYFWNLSWKGLSLSSRGCLVTYQWILFTISTATDIYKRGNTAKIVYELSIY